MRALLLVLVIACGGPQRPLAPPPFDAKALAAELDAHLAELARIIHARRDACPAMARDLRALFARMEPTLARARAAQQDPDHAKQLTTELRAYDRAAAEREAAIEADFGASSACARDADVRDAMQRMPTL